jgi:hypothetical protein
MAAGIQQTPIIDVSTPSLAQFWVNGMKAVRTFIGAAVSGNYPQDTFVTVTRDAIDLGKLLLTEQFNTPGDLHGSNIYF